MKRTLSFILASSLLLLGISCNNSPQPEEGKEYVKVEKGILLPVPDVNDSTKFDYTKVKVTFESDGVYMYTKELMRNAMLSVEFKTPQYKTTFGSKEYNSRVGLDFKDMHEATYVYFTPYSDFRKYTPYWTWDDVKGLRFVYHPESYKPVFISPLDYETYEEYAKAQQELGFEYEITIYRDYPDLEILNDPDFESVFELFRAHTTK